MLKKNLNSYIFGLLLPAIALVLFSAETNAQDVTARVTSVKGRATYSYKNAKNQTLKKGRSLGEGYEVRTSKKSRVVVSLSDGSQLVILANTRVVFGDFEKASSLRELIRVPLGKVRIKVKKSNNKPNPYKVRTPTASIAVRGTEFEVTVLANGETRVITTEGLVEVYSLKKPDESLFSEPGRGVIVRADFSLDFLNPNLSGNNSSGNSSVGTDIEVGSKSSSIISSNSQPAANAYERFSGNVVRSVENFTPSRSIAVSNPHFDSLDNPAYAGAFDYAEGQIYFLSGLSSDQNIADDSVSNNLDSFVSVDYNVGLQGTFFTPISDSRFIVGVSGSFVVNGLQPLEIETAENNTNLPGSTFNLYASGSLIAARTFGDQDQTTVGVSYDRLESEGYLGVTLDQNNPGNTPFFGFSLFDVTRNRFTVGVKHNFNRSELGLFYRYGRNRTILGNSEFVSNSNTNNSYQIESKSDSSEVGVQFRRTVTPRFFYGLEGSLFLEKSNDRVINGTGSTEITSTQNTNSNRTSFGAGVGYLFKPQTIFTLDVNGGFINGNSTRISDSSGEIVETNDRNSKFASFHAALQTDIWKGLFGSATVNSFYRNNALDQRIFTNNFQLQKNPFGESTNDIFRKNSVNYTFSDFGLGWRFSPNYIVQYVFTTDYGETAPRHNFLFKYSFDFGKD